MGKVKNVYVAIEKGDYIMYQFPMGKVKMNIAEGLELWLLLYQFPMGKVKERSYYDHSISIDN